MQNKTLRFALLAVLILALLGSAYFAWTKMKKPPKKAATTSETSSYQINNAIYKNLANPRDFGGTISTDAAGFGRENPFAPYK